MGLLARSQTLSSTGYPSYSGYPTVCYSLAHSVRVLTMSLSRDWSVSLCKRRAVAHWQSARLPSQSCSKPAEPTWVYQRHIIVSPL